MTTHPAALGNEHVHAHERPRLRLARSFAPRVATPPHDPPHAAAGERRGRLTRRRHRRQHHSVLLDPGPRVQSAAGVKDGAGFRSWNHGARPALPRRLLARVPGSADRLRRSRSCSRRGWSRSTSAAPGARCARSACSYRPTTSARWASCRRWAGSHAGGRPRPGAEPVAVISWGYWRTRLGGAPGVLGRTLRINDRHHDRGRGAAEVPGHRHDARLRHLGPGHDGAGAVRRLERAQDRGSRGYSVMGRLRA